MNQRLVITILAFLLIAGFQATSTSAQEQAPADTLFAAPTDSVAQAMPKPRSGWLFILPIVAYTPETEFAFGATAGRYYRFSDDPEARPTTFTPMAMVTTKSQVILGLFSDAWWGEDRWHLTGNLGFSKFPTSFYGIGDDTVEDAEELYTPSTASFMIDVNRIVTGSFYAGVILDLASTSIKDLDEDGQLVDGQILGSDGGGLVGLGASVTWDTRDAVFYPTQGWLNRLAMTRFSDNVGSDYTYTFTDINLAHYQSLGGSRVLAGNLGGSFISGGDAPFYRLPRLGLRGYFEERYLERNVIRGQVEFRTGIKGIFGAAVFAGLGEMGSSLSGLRLDEARPAAGVGLRINLGGDDRSNLRFDYGVGDGDSGFYVNFGEAF